MYMIPVITITDKTCKLTGKNHACRYQRQPMYTHQQCPRIRNVYRYSDEVWPNWQLAYLPHHTHRHVQLNFSMLQLHATVNGFLRVCYFGALSMLACGTNINSAKFNINIIKYKLNFTQLLS